METQNPLDQLTPEQRAAVVDYARRHGPAWKGDLLLAWSRASEPGLLQQVRNQFGPAWLAKVVIPAPVTVVVRDLTSGEQHELPAGTRACRPRRRTWDESEGAMKFAQLGVKARDLDTLGDFPPGAVVMVESNDTDDENHAIWWISKILEVR